MGTRRSRAEVENAIREATLAELAERGYAGVTFEGVAKRARTSKPVLYRRFPDRAHLVAGALEDELMDLAGGADGGRRAIVPGTSLRADLLAILSVSAMVARRLGTGTFRALLGEADDGILRALDAGSMQAAVALVGRAVDAAKSRGELGSHPIQADVLRAPIALVRDRALFGDITDDVVDGIVDHVAVPLLKAASNGL